MEKCTRISKCTNLPHYGICRGENKMIVCSFFFLSIERGQKLLGTIIYSIGPKGYGWRWFYSNHFVFLFDLCTSDYGLHYREVPTNHGDEQSGAIFGTYQPVLKTVRLFREYANEESVLQTLRIIIDVAQQQQGDLHRYRHWVVGVTPRMYLRLGLNA